ncbi:hypothetical protein ABVT39_018861 [Epinephelus coioides]
MFSLAGEAWGLTQEFLDHLDHLDLQDHMEHLDHLDLLDFLDLLEGLDLLDLLHSVDKEELETLKSLVKSKLTINYDFVRSVGQKYFVSNKEMGSFSRAVEFCSQRDLELALPQKEEENNILTQVFVESNENAWINVTNKAVGNFEADMKNQHLAFTKWGEGQPDKSIQDTGCTMLSENGVWKVTPECSLNAYIICQI